MSSTGTPIHSIRNLGVHFAQDEGLVRAVDGASFDLHPGKILGIVGESGCGKSVTARAVLQILDHPGRIVGGEIWLDRPGFSPVDIARLSPRSPDGNCSAAGRSRCAASSTAPGTGADTAFANRWSSPCSAR